VSIDPGRPGFRTLLDWLEGRLDAVRAERVTVQVAEADERTLRTVDWLRGFLTTARELPLEEPPPIVRQSLKQYFARWSRAQAVPGQMPHLVYVELLLDSRQDVPLAGVRPAAGDDTIGLVCTA
jgi:hypothetical protein